MSQIPPPPGDPYGGAPGQGSPAPQYSPDPSQGYGQPAAGQVPPQEKKRWPLFVGIGCGCALIAAIIVVVIIVAFSMRGGGTDDPTTAPPTETTEVETTEPETTEPETTEPETTEPETTAPETTAPETTAPAGEITEEDKTAASQRFLDFFGAFVGGDYEGACSYVADPTTGEPMTGAMLAGCAAGLESSTEGQDMSSYEGIISLLTVADIGATDNGDGTLAMDIYGSPMGMNMIKASDGQWYLDLNSVE
ncbi:hypothetical protein [Brachybacterium hainanense]|uniref:DUF4878 domain-containing protein n=1 Tax=Brachybacterium hainanense TaxID=1541174 RepID=A0ABV6RFZ6_9MICO